MLQNYSRVRLQTEKFQASGAHLFDVGYIIEVYPDGDYEVEFSDASGNTTAQIVVREEDIQLSEGVYEAPSRTGHRIPSPAGPEEIQLAEGVQKPPTPSEPARTIKEQLT